MRAQMLIAVLVLLLASTLPAAAQVAPRPPVPAGWTELAPAAPPGGVDPQLIAYVTARRYAMFAINLNRSDAGYGDKMYVERTDSGEISARVLDSFVAKIVAFDHSRVREKRIVAVGGREAAKLVLTSSDGQTTSLIYVFHEADGAHDAMLTYQIGARRFARMRHLFEAFERS